MKPASTLDFIKDYSSFPEFERYGIPLEFIDAVFIQDLQAERNDSGILLYPSPDPRGWVRFESEDEGSCHYAIGRLSNAGDLFPERGRIIEFIFSVLQSPRWGGVGIYSDTNGPDGKPWPMVHLDKRDNLKYKTVWARNGAVWGRDGKYYSIFEPGFKVVLNEIIKLDRRES